MSLWSILGGSSWEVKVLCVNWILNRFKFLLALVIYYLLTLLLANTTVCRRQLLVMLLGRSLANCEMMTLQTFSLIAGRSLVFCFILDPFLNLSCIMYYLFFVLMLLHLHVALLRLVMSMANKNLGGFANIWSNNNTWVLDLFILLLYTLGKLLLILLILV